MDKAPYKSKTLIGLLVTAVSSLSALIPHVLAGDVEAIVSAVLIVAGAALAYLGRADIGRRLIEASRKA